MGYEEYKVKSSSTLFIVVLCLDKLPALCFPPVWFTRSGDIVGWGGGTSLVKFNPEEQLQELHSCSDDPYRCDGTMYIESLLSLPG